LQLVGAHRSGIKTVVLPFANRKDVLAIDAGVPAKVQEDVEIVWVRSIDDVLEAVLPRVFRRGQEKGRNFHLSRL
jgi:ATP-dependent Lon protease